MKRHPEEKNFYSTDDDAAEAFFRQAAQTDGLPYHEWCLKYGIIDRAALAKIFRHERPLSDLALERAAGVVNRQGRYRRKGSAILSAGDRDFVSDPPFEVRLPSDVSPAPESAARRRLSPQSDAAAE